MISNADTRRDVRDEPRSHHRRPNQLPTRGAVVWRTTSARRERNFGLPLPIARLCWHAFERRPRGKIRDAKQHGRSGTDGPTGLLDAPRSRRGTGPSCARPDRSSPTTAAVARAAARFGEHACDSGTYVRVRRKRRPGTLWDAARGEGSVMVKESRCTSPSRGRNWRHWWLSWFPDHWLQRFRQVERVRRCPVLCEAQ